MYCKINICKTPLFFPFAVVFFLSPSIGLADISCSVSTTGVVFGLYSLFSTLPLNSTGNISVCCTGQGNPSVSYTIDLSQGSSNNYSQRTLINGRQQISYNLYTSSARMIIWGDGHGGTGDLSDSYKLKSGGIQNYPIYGMVPALQNVSTGTYHDTLTVSVNY